MLLNLTLIGWDQDKDLFPMTKFDSNFYYTEFPAAECNYIHNNLFPAIKSEI